MLLSSKYSIKGLLDASRCIHRTLDHSGHNPDKFYWILSASFSWERRQTMYLPGMFDAPRSRVEGAFGIAAPMHPSMSAGDRFTAELQSHIPSLHAYARYICRLDNQVDTIIFDTLVRAWANHEKRDQEIGIQAWLYSLLRDRYLARSCTLM
jgi:hypothetical protein